jgi:hypothetical protein
VDTDTCFNLVFGRSPDLSLFMRAVTKLCQHSENTFRFLLVRGAFWLSDLSYMVAPQVPGLRPAFAFSCFGPEDLC